ncbi:hypothetical protein evm_011048 [Chilo suppressalis]|nr:hypothetical protein evm_011048 [Chilo suppressalis]
MSLTPEECTRILTMLETGRSQHDIARTAGVSLSTVQRVLRCYKETGSKLRIPGTGRTRHKVYRRPGERFKQACIEEKVAYGGGSALVWAGISSESRTELVFIEQGSLTSERYVEEILNEHVDPFMVNLGEDAIFMNDNARDSCTACQTGHESRKSAVPTPERSAVCSVSLPALSNLEKKMFDDEENRKKTFLGFDFSTQRLKALVIGEDYKVLHEAEVEYDVDLPEFRYIQQI